MATLAEQLPGTYRLESYVSHPTPQSSIQRLTYPMTKNVTGLIIYSPDGYMSAQLQMPGQKGFDGSSDASWSEAGKRYFAYSGPFYITADGSAKETLRHSFELCVWPNRVGEIEIRSFRLEDAGKTLILGGEETVEIKGDKRIPVLTWRRVESNAGKPPPKELPKIEVS